MFVSTLMESSSDSLLWGASEYPGEEVFLERVGDWKKLCLVPCHSCYIYGTWRSEEVGRGEVLKSSYGGGHATKGD